MFIFMGLILERSGVAERALRSAQSALGGSAAGMGISVLLISVLLAASSGIVGASVVLLTLLALPRLLDTGFSKPAASGLIAASGTMAILLPPSVMLIVLGDQLQAPVPSMFSGAIGPALLMLLFYALYITFKARHLPRPAHANAESLITIAINVAPLLLLVLCVLGSIVAGIATPTEASGLGAFGAIVIAIVYRRFNFGVLMQAARETVIATSMVMMVMVGATCFSAVFRGIGGDEMIRDAMMVFGTDAWVVLSVIMLVIFVLGFVLDWLEISLILIPIFAPMIAGLDFNNGLDTDSILVWFGILVAVNLQTSFLTPPFGFSLFYLQGAAAGQVATGDVYRGVLPFIALQLLTLGLLMAFPSIVTALT